MVYIVLLDREGRKNSWKYDYFGTVGIFTDLGEATEYKNTTGGILKEFKSSIIISECKIEDVK